MYVPIKDLDVWINFENQTVTIEEPAYLTFGQLEVIVENIRLGLVSESSWRAFDGDDNE